MLTLSKALASSPTSVSFSSLSLGATFMADGAFHGMASVAVGDRCRTLRVFSNVLRRKRASLGFFLDNWAAIDGDEGWRSIDSSKAAATGIDSGEAGRKRPRGRGFDRRGGLIRSGLNFLWSSLETTSDRYTRRSLGRRGWCDVVIQDRPLRHRRLVRRRCVRTTMF
jgi:hypothetical protein